MIRLLRLNCYVVSGGKAGQYLNLVMSGQEIIVTKNGHEVARFIPKDAAVSYLTDSLTGILKGNYDMDEVKSERLKEKYGGID